MNRTRTFVLATLLIAVAMVPAQAQPAEDVLDQLDTDEDGFSDLKELLAGSSPQDPASTPIDRDGDGLNNTDEDRNNNGTVDPGETDPDQFDSDGDSFGDGYEVQKGSDPTNRLCRPHDIDCDSLYDYWERHYWGSIEPQGKWGDPDGDGLINHFEFYGGCNPLSPDTDSDGMLDGDEYHRGLICWAVDGDQDGYRDHVEVEAGSDPMWAASTPHDRDGDGYTNSQEESDEFCGGQGSDPDDFYSTPSDCDGDGAPWAVEQNLDTDYDARLKINFLPDNILGYCAFVYCDVERSVHALFEGRDAKPAPNPLSFSGATLYNPGTQVAILWVDVRDEHTRVWIGEVQDATGTGIIRSQEFYLPLDIPVGRQYVPFPLEFKVFMPTSGGTVTYDRDSDGIRSLYGPYREVGVSEDGTVHRDVRTRIGSMDFPDPDDGNRCVPLGRFPGC